MEFNEKTAEEQRADEELRATQAREAQRSASGGVQPAHRGYRSLFWPVVLIGAGLIFLLNNLGILNLANLGSLWRLWPVLLILLGLDVLFGGRSPALGGLLGLVVVGAVIGLLVWGPLAGIAPASAEIITERFSAPLNDARSAEVILDFGLGDGSIYASDGANLLDAEITHVGELELIDSGGRDRVLELRHPRGLGPLNIPLNPAESQRLRWDIGLHRDVPLALHVNMGVGNTTFELSDLQIDQLDLNGGVGDASITLPGRAVALTLNGGTGNSEITAASGANVTANLNAGVGDFTIELADDVSGSFDIERGVGKVMITAGRNNDLQIETGGGVGDLLLTVPAGTALRVEVRGGGLGDVSVPGSLRQIESREDGAGTWESADYAGAARRITVIVRERGVGGVTVRER